jgi:hypothetical protein|tara:strand:+ start:1365 stop:2093 length:729 start_codon:yes stop_codon:yes gene_type:complete
MIAILEKLKEDSFYYGEYGQQWLSNSDIYTLLNDPLQFRVPKQQTKAMLEGRYFHTAILEPDKIQNFIIVDVASRNTKRYKELVEEHGQMLLLQKEKEDLDKAILMIKSNMDMAEEIYHPSNKFEVPAIGNIMGLDWKGKADIICEDKIIDLKTTSDINKFRSSAYRYNYDSQAYIYQKLFGKPVHFYVVDKNTLQLGVYIPTDDFLKNGQEKAENAIFIYNTFFSKNSTEDINQHIIYETL